MPGGMSVPQAMGVQPVYSSCFAPDLLHEVLSSAGTVPAFSVPEADEVDFFSAKPHCGLKHPKVIALVGIIPHGQGAELFSGHVQRRA